MATATDYFNHDVFLSYFNEGTIKAFIDNLYQALVNKRINTFIKDDDDDGEIRSCIEEIENSRMSIVVLCENYGSSTSCLDELAKIVDGFDTKRRHVAAIFYKVEPAIIRKQKDAYKTAMDEHERRYGKDSEKVKTWRHALARVCDLCGAHFNENQSESKFIEKIVKDAFTKAAPAPVQMNNIFGLDACFEDVKSVFNMESNEMNRDTESNATVRMLGIYGAGGIGKTTFAAYLYDKIRHYFEASTFLLHVSDKFNRSTKGLEDLQKTLLSQMGEDLGAMVGSTFHGSVELKNMLGKRRVLLVLDDIDSIEKLNVLAGGRDWFGPGSRIIITTRDAAVLDNRNAEIEKYKMEALNDQDSLELFCWNAFHINRPAEHFEYMSSRATTYAKGIPLALCVIGSNLKDKSIEEWEIELAKYKKIPHADIQGVLEISYYSLSELEKKIFLDCACFFKGEKWAYVEGILGACDYSPSLRIFYSKCLMTIDEKGCLEMHDLIQDMGREIVRKESPLIPGKRSRLWSHKDILQVLKENSGSRAIEGIMLHPPMHEVVDHWTNNAFEKMKNLKILIVRNATFSTGPSCLPNSLRLLDWMGFPSNSFPPDFYPEKIIDLNLSHSPMILSKLLHEKFEDLTFMNLSHCQSITQIPDLRGAKNLRVLILDRCRQLKGFHESFGLFMSKLVHLSASECTMLESFVPRMYLPSLKFLSFNFCTRLECFPDVMKKMDNPLNIHLSNTAIKEFAESIGKLTGLEYVDMSGCKELRDLSRSFMLLPKLKTLKVDECSKLGESFKKFKVSHSIENGCSNLKELYFSKANLSCEDLHIILIIFPELELLNVSHNGFVSLPECVKGSLHLKVLDISFCRNLKDIPKFPSSIQKVDARYCQSLSQKASNVVWSKVYEDKERIQVVMPKTEIPNWFDYVGNEDIPLFWARLKFPIVALAFEFGGIKENDEIKIDTFTSEFFHRLMSDKSSHLVGLHLFVDGQEVCHKNYHIFIVGEHHVLTCDLRTLFNDEEWQGLDACLGDEWKKIEVQFESQLIVNHWGVYVYKQKTKTDDIRFTCPYSTDYLRSLVPKKSLNPKIKHIQSLDLVEAFGLYLNTFKSEQYASVAYELLRWCRNTRGGPHSTCVYGASSMQEDEDCVWNVVQILEMLMGKVANHISDAQVQSAGQVVVELLTTVAQQVKVKVHEALHINMSMPIILEECEERHRETLKGTGESTCQKGFELEVSIPSRRYWGSVDLQVGDRLVWRSCNRKETFWEKAGNIVILLKCQNCSVEEASSSRNVDYLEEVYEDSEVENLLRIIEKDAMSLSLNGSQRNWKAYIVPIDVPVSENYMVETAIIKGQERLGRLGCNFKKTAYGKFRVEFDAKCGNITMQEELRVEEHYAQDELRVEHHAQNEKQHELGDQSQSTNRRQNKVGQTKKSLIRRIGCCCCD